MVVPAPRQGPLFGEQAASALAPTLRHVSVENIFALTATNVVHAEWDLDEVDKEGKRYHVTGVTAFVVAGGRTRTAKDYIFDQPLLASIWPPRDATASDAGDQG